MTVRRADFIKDSLEAEIIAGQHAPGARLDEISLAERFNISRTPVREALFELSANGLIELRPNRGAVVAAFGPVRLVEMFEVLAGLLGLCARLAAERMRDAERNALEEALIALERIEAKGEAANFAAGETALHTILIDGCHNDYLAEQTLRLNLRLAPYHGRRLAVMDRANHLKKTTLLVEAIVTGDTATALICVGDIFRITPDELVKLLPANETGSPG